MKSVARFTLLFLWLFAIVAPSVITLINKENPVVVTNLNEEEHEAGKKTPVEEKFVHDYAFDFSLIAKLRRSAVGYFHFSGHVDHTLEILLPPPEQLG